MKLGLGLGLSKNKKEIRLPKSNLLLDMRSIDPEAEYIDFPELDIDVFDRDNTNFWDADNKLYPDYDALHPRRISVENLSKPEFLRSLMKNWHIFTQVIDGVLKRVVAYGKKTETDLVEGWDFDDFWKNVYITETTDTSFTGPNNGAVKKQCDFVVGETYRLKITGNSEASAGIYVHAFNYGLTTVLEVWNERVKGDFTIDKDITIPSNCDSIGFTISTTAPARLTTFTNFEVIKTTYSSISESDREKVLKALRDNESDATDYEFYLNCETSALLDGSNNPATLEDTVAKIKSISANAQGTGTNATLESDGEFFLQIASGGKIAYNKSLPYASQSVNGSDYFDVENNELTYSELTDYGYKVKKVIVQNLGLLSQFIYCRYNAGILRVTSKFDADNDIIIEFKDSLYNGLVTFNGVCLRANTNVRPDKYEGSVLSGVTRLNNADSDNLGPYKVTPAGATFDEWVGGSHHSTDEALENDTWQEVTAVTSNTIQLDDASDYFTPDVNQPKGYIVLKQWDGAKYATYGRYYYTGKSSNTLTGVAMHYSGLDITAISGIGGANPPYAVLVFKTAETTAVDFKLDGVALSDDGIWYKGTELVATINNTIYDPNTIRSNPLTKANWDELITEEIIYRWACGGSIDIDYSAEVKKQTDIGVYYGLQSVYPLFTPEKIFIPESSDSTLRPYEIGINSGAIADYPLADKFVIVNETINVIEDFKMDIDNGTPSEWETWIDDAGETTARLINPSKIYFNTINAIEDVAVETEISWRGVHNYCRNLVTTPNILVYKRRFKGFNYLVCDFTNSLTFPQTLNISSLSEVTGKTLTDDYVTTGITRSGYVITANNSGQIVIKLT